MYSTESEKVNPLITVE